MKFYGIDNNRSELDAVAAVFNDFGFDVNITESGDQFVDWMKESQRSDVLLSDGFMEEITLPFQHGWAQDVEAEVAGFTILDRGYNASNARALSRVLFSVHDIKENIRRRIMRLDNTGKIFRFISKNDPNYLHSIADLIKCHLVTNSRILNQEKFDYVAPIVEGWTSDPALQLAFFGIFNPTTTLRDLPNHGLFESRDFEDRCDAIFAIRRNLAAVFGDEIGKKERDWLQVDSSYLGGQSPIDLVQTRHQHELFHIVSMLEHH